MNSGRRARKEARARTRRMAEAILKVRGGSWTATRAARELGTSRRTYYKWEARALAGMIQELERPRGGRPSKPVDPEKESLRQEAVRLRKEKELLRQSVEILRSMRPGDRQEGKKR